jgi:hypothetical protein
MNGRFRSATGSPRGSVPRPLPGTRAGVARPAQGLGMDRLREFLDTVKQHGSAGGNFLGLLHLLIGRRITLADGTPVCPGLSWREAAALLKRVRWDREAVRELGLEPAALPPRDRLRYWYTAIALARVDSAEAAAAGDRLAAALGAAGYRVSPAPALPPP